MSFKYRAITANCGNDAIGMTAASTIANQIKNDDADFYVINCQEVDFDTTLSQLLTTCAPEYQVAIVGNMSTHTKLTTQFHDGTGIASFVIYKNTCALPPPETRAARRNNNRLSGGSGYNKGGLISDFTLIKNREIIKIQAISAHLDSNNIQKRSQDWLNISHAMEADIETWAGLVALIPDLRLSGYDANTRNNTDSGNLWKDWANSQELRALTLAPLAGQHFSKESTYKTNQQGLFAEDKKRPGYLTGGMLDFISVADGSHTSFNIESGENVVQIGMESGTNRDHDVIISPLLQFTPLDDFAKVQGQMAIRLQQAWPELAVTIRAMKDNNTNRATLVNLYQNYLSPHGILHQIVDSHVKQPESTVHLSDFFSTRAPGNLRRQLEHNMENLRLVLERSRHLREQGMAVLKAIQAIIENERLNLRQMSLLNDSVIACTEASLDKISACARQAHQFPSTRWEKLHLCMARFAYAALLTITAITVVGTLGIAALFLDTIAPLFKALSRQIDTNKSSLTHALTDYKQAIVEGIPDDQEPCEEINFHV